MSCAMGSGKQQPVTSRAAPCPAELDLNVRFLSGQTQHVRVAPNTSIEQLRASFEAGLSPFYSARLIVGMQELRECTVVEAGIEQGSEVQVVFDRCPGKAIAMIEANITSIVDFENWYAVTRDIQHAQFVTFLEDIHPALQFLGDAADLDILHCQEFMTFHDRICEVLPYDVQDWLDCSIKLGECFGLACSDPSPFIDRLMGMDEGEDEERGTGCALFSLHALFKIDCREEAYLCGRTSSLASLLQRSLRLAVGCGHGRPNRDHFSDAMWVTAMEYFVQPLVHFSIKFGNLTALEQLEEFPAYLLDQDPAYLQLLSLDEGVENLKRRRGDVHELIKAAKEQIEQRRNEQAFTQEGVAVQMSHIAATPAAAGEVGMIALPSGDLEGGETEQGLDEALSKSETEALQQEQAQLQEALVRSKADIEAVGTGCGSSNRGTVPILLLQYSKSQRWLHDALVKGMQEEHEALSRAGFSSKLPSGAKIFVAPEVFRAVVQYLDTNGWELKTSHVIIAQELEEKILTVVETSRSATKRHERGSCKVKEYAALEVPFAQEENVQTLATATDDAYDYVVKRTFVEIPIFSSMCSGSSFRPATW